MRTLASASLALALCAVPVSAQKMGSANTNAPSIEQSIKLGDDTLTLTYTAITWAGGQMMEAAMDKDSGGRARQRINNTAEKAPLGTLKASADFDIGGKAVAAGEYKLFFTIDDDLKWHMVAASGDKRVDWTLPLEESDKHRSRLIVALIAGDEDGTGALAIAFGKQNCKVELAPGGGQGK